MAEHDLTCDGCLNKIVDRTYLKCFNCHKNYDLLCANVSKEQLSTVGLTWKCALCKSAEPKYDNTNTPLRAENHHVTMHRGARAHNQMSPNEFEVSSVMDVSYMDSQQHNNVTTPPNNFSTFNATSRTTEMHMLMSELRLFREEMRAMTHQLHELRVTVENINTRIDSCDGHINVLYARVDALESKTEACQNQHSETHLLETIAQLKMELNDRAQDQLMNDLEISCVPETRGENTSHVALTLSQKLGVALTENDIVDATRVGRATQLDEGVPGPAPRPRLIVVRLARRAVRDRLLQAARVRRGATTEGTGLPGAPARFYVNERLTPTNRRLFQRARELRQQHDWRHSWTRDGKIFVRQRSGEDIPKYRIRSEQDLTRVFG